MRVIPHDKALHIIAGTAAAMLGMFIGAFTGSPYGVMFTGAMFGLIAALGREFYNASNNGPFDWLDIVYTVFGGLLAILCGVPILILGSP
jgi:hypothetical protein